MAKENQGSRSQGANGDKKSTSSKSRASQGFSGDEMNLGSEGIESSASRTQNSDDSTQRKSISALISQSLAEESQEGVDRVMNEFKTYMDKTRQYIAENPREAAGLAIAAGIGAWVLLGTKPGRAMLESGLAVGVPFATKWVSRNFSGAGQEGSTNVAH